MKKYALFLLAAFATSTTFSQKNNATVSNKKTEKSSANNDVASAALTSPSSTTTKANTVVPDAKFAKIKVIESYERVLEKGYKTEAMLTKVADYRFFDGDLVTAAKWYSQLFEYCPEELEAVYFYRYSKSLESIDQMEKAKEMMALYQKKKL